MKHKQEITDNVLGKIATAGVSGVTLNNLLDPVFMGCDCSEEQLGFALAGLELQELVFYVSGLKLESGRTTYYIK